MSWELPDPPRDEDAPDAQERNWAFQDALLALDELDHDEVADRLRERWREPG